MRSIVTFLAAFFILGSAGCRNRSLPTDLPALYSVSVTVVQNDRPLPGAMVSFVPLDPESRWSAGGQTDEKGKTSIKTHGVYGGVAVGDYKIVVTKVFSDMNDPDKASGHIRAATRYHLIDPRYASVETTPIELRIEKKADLSFDVGEAVKIHIPFVE